MPNDLPLLVVDREQLRSLRWEGGCPDCWGEGFLEDEIRCPCLHSEATVTLNERPMRPCPHVGRWTHLCPGCGVSDTSHKPIPIPVGTRVEVGWSAYMLRDHFPTDVWYPVATATVAEVLFLHGEDWIIELTNIEATP